LYSRSLDGQLHHWLQVWDAVNLYVV